MLLLKLHAEASAEGREVSNDLHSGVHLAGRKKELHAHHPSLHLSVQFTVIITKNSDA